MLSPVGNSHGSPLWTVLAFSFWPQRTEIEHRCFSVRVSFCLLHQGSHGPLSLETRVPWGFPGHSSLGFLSSGFRAPKRSPCFLSSYFYVFVILVSFLGNFLNFIVHILCFFLILFSCFSFWGESEDATCLQMGLLCLSLPRHPACLHALPASKTTLLSLTWRPFYPPSSSRWHLGREWQWVPLFGTASLSSSCLIVYGWNLPLRSGPEATWSLPRGTAQVPCGASFLSHSSPIWKGGPSKWGCHFGVPTKDDWEYWSHGKKMNYSKDG